MNGVTITGIVILVLILLIVGPVIVASSLVTLFALPFWPCFWLAFGVGMITGGSNTK